MHHKAFCFYADLDFGVLYTQTDLSQSIAYLLHMAFFFWKFHNHGGYEQEEGGIDDLDSALEV